MTDTSVFDTADSEWANRKIEDLGNYYPKSEVPFGFMTSMNNGGIPNHGYTHWWTMFNSRQLLVNSQLLKVITGIGRKKYSQVTFEFVLGAFQQYLRNQNMFCFWDISRDCLAPHMSNNNYHPKVNFVENCVFPQLGRGNWQSCSEGIVDSIDWINNPWDVLSAKTLRTKHSALAEQIHGTSIKVSCNDPVLSDVSLVCKSATELAQISTQAYDLVITDPPFGGLLHYAELADFFYVWLKLALQENYPEEFAGEYTPKALECVSNKARHPDDPDGFYQRLLTQCYREANRILKPSGLLAFTFHHGEDAPWVSVLESLFDAGFYLEAAYPIRSDETKGEGSKPGTFGSQQIEYDIVHVCRKRIEEPTPVSWGKMRREVLRSVQQLKEVLEIHAKAGLPAADLQVIKRGKALEYYSQHYGKVYVDEGKPITVKEALVGINQLLDEESGNTQAPPPVTAEPFTRQFLRIFDSVDEHPRDQMQKYLRGTGISPKEFEERGWCKEDKKIYYLTSPREIAQSLHGKHRQKINSDYDQAMFFIGSCFDGSGIKINDTLNNANFRPHPALSALLEWHSKRGATPEIRNGAARALQIFQIWERQNKPQIAKQLEFFGEE